MNVKLAYLAAGLLAGVALPYVAAATLNARPASAAASTGSVVAAFAPQAQHYVGSPGVFAQYDSPAPDVYEVPAGTSNQGASGLTTGGAPVNGSGPSTLSPAPSHIAADVDVGVTNMKKALATAPVAMAKMTESIARNGVIAALAYDDPQVKAQTDQLGQQIGASLRGFADAIAKDMQRSIKESGIQQLSAGR